MAISNPCLTCGACCAHYRVSFYWGEADPGQGGVVPIEWTEDVTAFRRCMRGTNYPPVRCLALNGNIGQAVSCVLYEQRPSPCREFGITFLPGEQRFDVGDLDRCNEARAAWGLPLLSMEYFQAEVVPPRLILVEPSGPDGRQPQQPGGSHAA